MDNELFERMREQRRVALEEARRRRREQFSPHRVGAIERVEWDEDESDTTRVTLKLVTQDNVCHTLPLFYRAHAVHLERLSPAERTRYLCDIWLNYSACSKRPTGSKGTSLQGKAGP